MTTKKCLILDLDNTLWHGIAGEGTAKIDSHSIAFQQAIKELKDDGVLLAICSLNNYGDVKKFLMDDENMILENSDFATSYINWRAKYKNIVAISKELNIGLDSLVFLDDDPVQRELVRQALPEVEVPEMPKNHEEYTQFLLSLSYFKKDAITDEDRMRTNFFITERLRQKDKSYKDSLIVQSISWPNPKELERYEQIIQKTNQFNINPSIFKSYETSTYLKKPEYRFIGFNAKDKFGDYGIIGLVILKYNLLNHSFLIQGWWISCRALGRGIEEAILSDIKSICQSRNIRRLEIVLGKTERNQPAYDFVSKNFEEKDIIFSE